MDENVTLEFVESQAETTTETGFPAVLVPLYVFPICGTFVPVLGEHGLGLRLGDGLRDGDGDGLGLKGEPPGLGDGLGLTGELPGLGLGTVLGALDEPPGLGLAEEDENVLYTKKSKTRVRKIPAPINSGSGPFLARGASIILPLFFLVPHIKN